MSILHTNKKNNTHKTVPEYNKYKIYNYNILLYIIV